MTIRANSNSKFLRRFLLIAAVCFGYLIWCTYDVLVTSPKSMKKAKMYWEQVEEDGKPVWKQKHTGEEWSRIVKENNWKAVQPKKPSEAVGFLYFNVALGLVCLVGGAMATHRYLRTNNTWIELDGDRLHTSWGQEFTIKDVQMIDKKRWERKGLAVITYQNDSSKGQFTLDDFKYDRPETDEILYQIEQKLKDDQIVNGDREISAEEREARKRQEEEKRKSLDVVEED